MKISGNDDDDKIVTEFNGPRERAERLRLNQEKMKFSSMICDSIFNYLYLQTRGCEYSVLNANSNLSKRTTRKQMTLTIKKAL